MGVLQIIVTVIPIIVFICGLIAQILAIGILLGKFSAFKEHVQRELEEIKKKQDKHNNFIERLTRCEASSASAHKRINEIKGEL